MITGTTLVAGVVGAPIRHSLSPLLHNAWIAAAGLDAVYVAFPPPPERFTAFVEGCRGGAIRGLNVTLPFKEAALACADHATPSAKAAQAANLLVFERDGTITADNTDGAGLLGAFAAQAPGFDPKAGPVVILGAGGAARGAAAAFAAAGCPEIRIVNRTFSKALSLAADLGSPVHALEPGAGKKAFGDAIAVVNATSAGLDGAGALDIPLAETPKGAVVMDMVYKPLVTPFLAQAKALGRPTVDGLEMLVRQAVPSFEAFFGQPPPAQVDVRAIALKALGLSA
jgi:shikimate dehydrogenase